VDTTGIKKIYRFVQVYGLGRTMNKTFGHLRMSWVKRLYLGKPQREVSVIGCGQFSFSTISYFIAREKGNVFLSAYDINPLQTETLTNFHRF
jgi:hypothetical protein